MSSTYLSLCYHLVFSTKNRVPLIRESWRTQLFGYLAGTIESLGGRCEIVGGMEDHVHILVRLRATHMLADFMCELKKASSAWVHKDRGKQNLRGRMGTRPLRPVLLRRMKFGAISRVRPRIIGNEVSSRN